MMNDQLDYVRALYVIGADGFIAHDTDYPKTPRVSLADRNYFQIFTDEPADPIFIGSPLLSRSVERWFVPVARRFEDPDGSFAGVVAAAVEPLFFERI
jgi:two-component system, NtrC family, sensor kinase